MWRRQRRVNGVGIVYRHGKSGSGVGCACGLIKLIITSVHPNISTRQLHSVSSHLLYVILFSRRPMRGSMLCQLFECYSCSFVRASFSVSLSPCTKILDKIHLFSPPGRLLSISPPHRPDVIRHCNSDDSCSLLSLSSGPVSFSSAGGERRCSPDTNKDEEGIIKTGARGLRSHRLADMYIQHSGTGQKKKEERLLELFCWLRATKRDKRKEILIGFFPYKMDGLSWSPSVACFSPFW